jgi:hypothetical protein
LFPEALQSHEATLFLSAAANRCTAQHASRDIHLCAKEGGVSNEPWPSSDPPAKV